MTGIPPQEKLGEEPPIIKIVSDLFTEAYRQQMDGGMPLHEFVGLGGKVEAIALNPKDYRGQGDNLRFILSGGSLSFGGFNTDIEGKEVDIKYAIYKITLPPGNIRPIEDLFAEEVTLSTVYLVSEDGHIIHVIHGPLVLEAEEVTTLTASLENCELAPQMPEWARETSR